jgi:hypothetical protein
VLIVLLEATLINQGAQLVYVAKMVKSVQQAPQRVSLVYQVSTRETTFLVMNARLTVIRVPPFKQYALNVSQGSFHSLQELPLVFLVPLEDYQLVLVMDAIIAQEGDIPIVQDQVHAEIVLMA